MLPLKGITVVSIEQAIAAPFATRQLADLGARVIKIERPEVGDFARDYDTTVNGLSSHFVWCNRSKESLAIDLKSETGKDVLEKLLARADVFIENLAPGAIERLGFGASRLQKEYPQLIIGNVSGYGKGGPYEQKKAYDLLIQCEAGLVSITGTEEEPVKVGISIADIAAGMYLFTGVLTALLQREKTGKGMIIEVSMLEALGEWMGYPAYYAYYGGEEPKRAGASHATIFPYGPYTCRDGKTVFLGIQNDREWQRFCKHVLQDEALSNDPRFVKNSARAQNRHLLQPLIEAKLRAMDSTEVMKLLEANDIANARLNTMREFMAHEQLKSRNRFRTIETEKGPIKALLPPVTMQGVTPVMNKVPRLGEHNEKIFAELYGTHLQSEER